MGGGGGGGGGGGDDDDNNNSTQLTAQCRAIKTYSTSGNLLDAAGRLQLKAGDKIRLAVGGSTNQGSITRARFKINSGNWQETTSTNSSGEFYYDYTIPSGGTNFSVQAQIYHSTEGWF